MNSSCMVGHFINITIAIAKVNQMQIIHETLASYTCDVLSVCLCFVCTHVYMLCACIAH